MRNDELRLIQFRPIHQVMEPPSRSHIILAWATHIRTKMPVGTSNLISSKKKAAQYLFYMLEKGYRAVAKASGGDACHYFA